MKQAEKHLACLEMCDAKSIRPIRTLLSSTATAEEKADAQAVLDKYEARANNFRANAPATLNSFLNTLPSGDFRGIELIDPDTGVKK